MIKAIMEFEDNSVVIHKENVSWVGNKLRPSLYSIYKTDKSYEINKEEFKEIHEPFTNQETTGILEAVSKFIDSKYMKICNDMGFIYKLNILLYGKQGTGKTSFINYICRHLLRENEAIIIRIDSPIDLSTAWGIAEQIRKIQDNLIVFVIDEFEMFASGKMEASMKNMLDGNRSINNSMVFAATNYIDKIPTPIKDRPSRFRIVKEIKGIKDKNVIKSIINKLLAKLEDYDVKEINMNKEQVDDLAHAIVSNEANPTVDIVKNIVINKIMDMKVDIKVDGKIGFRKDDVEPHSSQDDERARTQKILTKFGIRDMLEDIV